MLDYLAEDQNTIIKKGLANVHLSFQFKKKIILDKYTLLKKVFKHKAEIQN